MSIAAEQGAERLARVDGAWEAVDRIEITGSPERRTFTKFGADGKPLETTGSARSRARCRCRRPERSMSLPL